LVEQNLKGVVQDALTVRKVFLDEHSIELLLCRW
jgi:hypothetical protein